MNSLFIAIFALSLTDLAAVGINDLIAPFGLAFTGDTEYLHNGGALARRGEINHAEREAPAELVGSFWDSKDAYLGETPPNDVPKIFAPGRLTDSGTFTMGRTAFSKDGREFYYAQNDSWESGKHAKVKMVRFENGHWNAPKVIAEELVSPTLSLDDQTLYLRAGGMRNVWRATRTADGWSTPSVYLEETFGLYDFMPTASGRFYVGSDPDEEDRKRGSTMVFSVLTISAGKLSVKSLGRPLNAAGFNGDLFVAPDESYMIVSAKETPTFESELHISYPNKDGTWTVPVSLGPKINAGLAHRWGQYVTPDGKYLFFSHGTSEKDCAVHWVRFTPPKR